MKPRFLIDENLSPKTTAFLRKLGFDAQRIDEVGLKVARDLQILAYARRNGMIIITRDKDFAQTHYFCGDTVGTMVISTPNPTVENVNRLLEAFLKRVQPDRLKKSLIFLTEIAYRIIERPKKDEYGPS